MNILDLHALPSISFKRRKELPEIPAIYIVSQDDDILYVGRAINLRKRWFNHHRASQVAVLSNPVITWETTDVNTLSLKESAYIKSLRPLWNNKFGKSPRAFRLGEVLRYYRLFAGLTTCQLAPSIGISHGTLARIERGEKMKGVTLAKVLGWLMAREKERK